MSPPAKHAKLSLLDVVAQSVGFMGPVFSGTIVLGLLIGLNATGKGAGSAAPLAVVLAAVGMFALGWLVSAYARRVRAAGSLYNYVTLGLGEKAGAAAGYVYYSGVMILGAAIAVFVGGFVHDTLKARLGFDAIPTLVWQLGLLAGLLVVVHVGVQVSTRAQLVLALVSMTVLTLFFLYVIVKTGSGNSVKAFRPSSSGDGWAGILFAVLYGVLLFTGFEAAANLAEETGSPERHIPRAVLISLAVASAFFLLGTYAQVAGFHFDVHAMQQAAAGSPLVTLASGHAYGASWLGDLVAVMVMLDLLAVYIGVSVSVGRGLQTMAKDGWLPARLARESARRGTPVGATALTGAVYLLCVVASQIAPKLVAPAGASGYGPWYGWLSAYGVFCLAAIYLAMAVGAPRGLRDLGRPVQVWSCSVLAALITGGAVFGSIYKVPQPTLTASYLAIASVLVAVVAALVVKGGAVTGEVPVREQVAP
ncbi:APC family permease [Actinoallomurus sp. CA-150999]|uniref:APC family permease n=1 Tax=Actinoallomurus sp. CA-150999 TaxID=3239887 RepID=UPI003D94D578